MPRSSGALPRGGRFFLFIIARGLLVCCAHECLPPRQSPRPPALLKPSEAQRDGTGALFEQRGRPVLAPLRLDQWPGLSMVCGDEMQDKLSPVVPQCLECRALLHTGQGAKFVPIAAEDR